MGKSFDLGRVKFNEENFSECKSLKNFDSDDHDNTLRGQISANRSKKAEQKLEHQRMLASMQQPHASMSDNTGHHQPVKGLREQQPVMKGPETATNQPMAMIMTDQPNLTGRHAFAQDKLSIVQEKFAQIKSLHLSLFTKLKASDLELFIDSICVLEEHIDIMIETLMKYQYMDIYADEMAFTPAIEIEDNEPIID